MKNKSKNKALSYFFLISLAFHTVFLGYLGQTIRERHCERRIEVDLKSPTTTTPIRSIPQPYKRPKAVPQTKQIKTLVKSLAPKTIFSQATVKALASKNNFSTQAVEKIYSPWPDSLARTAHSAYSVLGSQEGLGVGIVGQIKAVEIPQVPATIRVATDTFDHTLAYKSIVRQRIEEHKHFPPQAVKRGLEGRVGLCFLLFRDGHVEEIKVTTTSHISLLDEAAREAVKSSNPFPSFPEGISQDSMVIEVTLNFELRK